jgi:hypothetical protein
MSKKMEIKTQYAATVAGNTATKVLAASVEEAKALIRKELEGDPELLQMWVDNGEVVNNVIDHKPPEPAKKVEEKVTESAVDPGNKNADNDGSGPSTALVIEEKVQNWASEALLTLTDIMCSSNEWTLEQADKTLAQLTVLLKAVKPNSIPIPPVTPKPSKGNFTPTPVNQLSPGDLVILPGLTTWTNWVARLKSITGNKAIVEYEQGNQVYDYSTKVENLVKYTGPCNLPKYWGKQFK